MDLGLNGRTAIVCGASQGIGLAVAEALAEEGANVAMFARRREVLEREAERIGALAIRGDVTNPQDCERLVKRTVEAFGGIDILVNNSGGPPRGPALELDEESIEAAVSLLLVSAVRLTNLCLRHLRKSEAGRIINIESSSVREPIENLALSNVVRPGVIGWAKSLAREIGPDGITVNSIATGRIDTERLAESFKQRSRADSQNEIPLKRFGKPRELADVVCFLASERARVRHRHDDPGRRRAHTRTALSLNAFSGRATILSAWRASSRRFGSRRQDSFCSHSRRPSSSCPRTATCCSRTRRGRSSPLVEVEGEKPVSGRRRDLLRCRRCAQGIAVRARLPGDP